MSDWDEEIASPTVSTQNGSYQRSSNYSRRQNNYNRPRRNENLFNGETMEVPSRLVGKIIGRGGSKINDLQFESGAKINITKEELNGNTIVRIAGAKNEIEKAKDLITDLITEKPSVPKLKFVPMDQIQTKIELPSDNFDWKALIEENDRLAKEELAKKPPIIKNFYEEWPSVANMNPQEVAKFREENNKIVVSRVFSEKFGDKHIQNPVKSFEQAFSNYPEILFEIKKAGFETPSPIQSQAWPVLLSGEDLIGIAQTGTGKTLAFLLPALIHIEGQTVPRHEREGPTVLILAPTRELALQIDREVKKYCYKNIKAVCIYGGGSRKEQIETVSEGVEIVIATPGRLNDLVITKKLSLKAVSYVVLDEADRMLDMGFEPQIRKSLYTIRPDRQTVMTSATWPIGVRRLADSYMENPIQIYVGSLDLAAVHTVTQTIIMLENDEDVKFEVFMEFAKTMQQDWKCIVFCGKKTRADFLSSELALNGIDCQVIHGNREQIDREQAIEDISSGAVQILVATDVASRGIDIEDITHVINYDFPRNIEEYVHRVGRTGRAGRTGASISYFTSADWSHAGELIPILEEANQYVPEELSRMNERYEAMKKRKEETRGNGFGGRSRFGGGNRRY